MVYCPLFRCLDSSEFKSESQLSKRIKETARPLSAHTLELKTYPSSSSNGGSTQSSIKKALEADKESDENIAPKHRVLQSNSVDTFCTDRYGKLNRDFLEECPRTSFWKNFGKGIGGKSVGFSSLNQCTRAISAGFIGRDRGRWSNDSRASRRGFSLGRKELSVDSSTRKSDTTLISDWSECYMSGELLITKTNADLWHVYGENFEECMLSLNSTSSTRKKSLTVYEEAPSTTSNMTVPLGMVWAMVLEKSGWAFQFLNLSFSLRRVVDTFLKVETGVSLPVSFTLSTDTRPKLLSAENMTMTLSENLKGSLDETTQGLTFVAGPVNGKLCYKMVVCDLKHLQMCFAATKKRE